MGLDVWLTNHSKTVDEVRSNAHPEHVFKKTYLRSSYNESGFNAVVSNSVGMGLYHVFGLSGDPEEDGNGIVHVDFQASRERAVELLEKLRQADGLCVMTVSSELLRQHAQVNARQALETFRGERDREQDARFRNYGNAKGEFLLDGLQALGFVRGVDLLGRPAIHVIHKDEAFNWYVQAAEVLVEFIDYALTLEDPGLRWSA